MSYKVQLIICLFFKPHNDSLLGTYLMCTSLACTRHFILQAATAVVRVHAGMRHEAASYWAALAGLGSVQHSPVAHEEGGGAELSGAGGYSSRPPISPCLGNHGQLLLPPEGTVTEYCSAVTDVLQVSSKQTMTMQLQLLQ